MRSRLLNLLTPLALAALVGSPASATMVAGWDFSQYFGDGLLSIDGASFTQTLDANYSDLDPSFGAGPDSGVYGTMHIDGSFGSTNVNLGGPEFAPSAAVGGSLVSNLAAPGPGADFESLTTLASEGQTFTESLAMIAAATSVVVFEADLTSVGQEGSDWSISFAARTSSGTSVIGVEFSSDGVNFTSLPGVNVNTVDSGFTVNLSGDATQTAYVRLSFNPSGADQPLIDNLAFSAGTLSAVPEPSVAMLGAVGLIGLAIAGRKRAHRG